MAGSSTAMEMPEAISRAGHKYSPQETFEITSRRQISGASRLLAKEKRMAELAWPYRADAEKAEHRRGSAEILPESLGRFQ